MSNTATALAALITAVISGALGVFAAYKSHQSEKHSASAEMVKAESDARQALAQDFRAGLKDCRDECHELRERVAALEANNNELKLENSKLRTEVNSLKARKG